MLDATRIAESSLDPVATVVEQLRRHAPDMDPARIMLVGAWCRDTLHAALGHAFDTGATRDIDIALALSSWGPYERLARAFPRVGDSGVGFRIAGSTVDLIPFGEPEDPSGRIVPPTRGDAISVWAFVEIFRDSWPLTVSPSLTIRCPTVPGYTAAKLAAWLDRSEHDQPRDAEDLALAVHWYAESMQVADRLYDSAGGQRILLDEELDFARAAARMLGKDVAVTVGAVRAGELATRWPGNLDMLVTNFRLRTRPNWRSRERRREIVGALTRGLAEHQAPAGSPSPTIAGPHVEAEQ